MSSRSYVWFHPTVHPRPTSPIPFSGRATASFRAFLSRQRLKLRKRTTEGTPDIRRMHGADISSSIGSNSRFILSQDGFRGSNASTNESSLS